MVSLLFNVQGNDRIKDNMKAQGGLQFSKWNVFIKI